MKETKFLTSLWVFYATQNYEKEIGEKYIDIFIQVNLATVTPISINQ